MHLVHGVHPTIKMEIIMQENDKERTTEKDAAVDAVQQEAPCILEEIKIEELAIDGICGVY